MKLLAALAVLVVNFTLADICHAQPVFVDDPGFESPNIGSLLGGLDVYTYNSVTPNYINGSSGWYVSAGTEGNGSVTLVDQGLIGALISPLTGNPSGQYMALNGLAVNLLNITPGALGGVSQVIATTSGQTYQVTYQAAALSLGVATTNTAQLFAGVDGVTVTSPSGGALLNLGVGTFADQSFTFTATGSQSVVDFHENSALLANVGGIAIDNVSITAVPEPSQSAAILLGCALVLMVGRRIVVARQSSRPKILII